MMFVELPNFKARLISLVHHGHKASPSEYDPDGACLACDNPFGASNHMCFGAAPMIDRKLIAS